MGAIEHLTVALSAEAIGSIRARVASGDYTDEGAVIEQALAALRALDDDIASTLPEVRDDEVERWLRTEVATIFDEHDLDSSSVLSIDDVRRSLATARRERAGG